MEMTGLILTYNEEPNIKRTLDALTDLEKIIVVDSFSTDRTKEIILSYPNTELHERAFDSFAGQTNFGVSLCSTKWILSIDADYYFPKEAMEEVKSIDFMSAKNSAFSIHFKYAIDGKPLRGALLPPRLIIFDKTQSHYIQDGHAHKLVTQGEVIELKNRIWHDDRKPLSRWLSAQEKYSNQEVDKFFDKSIDLSLADKIRQKKYFAPFIVFFYCYFFKLGFLDGKRGLFYAFQRTYVELMFSLKLIDRSFEDEP